MPKTITFEAPGAIDSLTIVVNDKAAIVTVTATARGVGEMVESGTVSTWPIPIDDPLLAPLLAFAHKLWCGSRGYE
jgi:hypothetical protein